MGTPPRLPAQRCACGSTSFEPVFRRIKPCWVNTEGPQPPPIAVLRCKQCRSLGWAEPRPKKGKMTV